jgi:hypothetical protein
VRAGGDGDDPRRRAGLQAVQQQVRVDQHIQPRIGVEYLAGQAADLGCCGLGADTVASGDADPGARAARPAAVALPMPAVPPVTRTTLPVMWGVSGIAVSLRQTGAAYYRPGRARH